MSGVISGIGQVGLVTRQNVDIFSSRILLCNDVSGFGITTDEETTEAFKYGDDCVRRKVFEKIISETRSISIMYEAGGWQELQQAEDEVATSSNITIPVKKTATFNSSGEITDTDLSSASIAGDLTLSIVSRGTDASPGDVGFRALSATPATPAAGEFGYDVGTNRILVDSSDYGAKACYVIQKTLTGAEHIGFASNPSELGQLSFVGFVCVENEEVSRDYRIWIPNLKLIGRPDFNFEGEFPSLEFEYEALASNESNKPVVWIREAAA